MGISIDLVLLVEYNSIAQVRGNQHKNNIRGDEIRQSLRLAILHFKFGQKF